MWTQDTGDVELPKRRNHCSRCDASTEIVIAFWFDGDFSWRVISGGGIWLKTKEDGNQTYIHSRNQTFEDEIPIENGFFSMENVSFQGGIAP